MFVDAARSVAIVAASCYFVFEVTCHSVSLGLLSAFVTFICASEYPCLPCRRRNELLTTHSLAPFCIEPNRDVVNWWRDCLEELYWVGRTLNNATLLFSSFTVGFFSTCSSAYLVGLDANPAAFKLTLVISIVCYGGITVLVSHRVEDHRRGFSFLLPSTRLKNRFASIHR